MMAAFFVTLREGLETVGFLLAILGATGDVTGALIWAAAGLVTAAVIGWAIFAMGIRIDLRRLFLVTSVLLIFVAAGLCAYAVRELTEAGWLPLAPVAFDVSGILSDRNSLGSVLAGLFGYRSAPTVLEVVAWFGYLVPVMLLFLWPTISPLRRRLPGTAG